MSLDLLWIATKPPWPPIDGGRLVQWLTLQALAERGARVTVVAPADAGGPVHAQVDVEEVKREIGAYATPVLVSAGSAETATAGPLRTVLRTLIRTRPGGLPLAIARHLRPAVRAEVARLVAEQRFGAVHVEQIHALPQAEPAVTAGLPLVLRAQNVESDLWAGAAESGGLSGFRGLAATAEARRLAAWEGRTVRRAAATIALTARDADRLWRLASGSDSETPRADRPSSRAGADTPTRSVLHVPAPFPVSLPAADRPLAGAPPVVVLGSGGWLPNAVAARWFVFEIWPLVHRALPDAFLHVFGADPTAPPSGIAGVELHLPPADSRDAFAPGSILAVPLRIASGVRMKILEAWARGIPVVATPEAAAGLEAQADRELLIADSAPEFAAAIRRLHREPELVQSLVSAGHAALATDHDPGAVADRLLEIYLSAASRS